MVQARLQYLTWAARQQLRERTVEVLETVGVTFRLPEAVEPLAEAGAIVNRATSRYGSPWSPIGDALKTAARSCCSPRATIVATWCSGTAVSACVAAVPRRVWSMTRPAGGCPVRPPDYGRSCACSKPCALCDGVWPSLFARDSTAECGRHLEAAGWPEIVAPLLDILRAVA